MGGIIYWTLIRLALVILGVWYSIDFIESRFLWTIVAIASYLIVIHPAILQYKKYRVVHDVVKSETLCAKCKHFDESAILCLKYDEHITLDEIPCGGIHWEPKN